MVITKMAMSRANRLPRKINRNESPDLMDEKPQTDIEFYLNSVTECNCKRKKGQRETH